MSSTHLGTTRNPQSEARRQHIHGDLIGLPDTRPYWPALRILAKQALCLSLPIFAAWGLLIAFS